MGPTTPPPQPFLYKHLFLASTLSTNQIHSAPEVLRPPHTPAHGAVLAAMSEPHSPPPLTLSPPPSFRPPPSLPTTSSLYKQRSWSPDMCREEAWLRRKGARKSRLRSKSVTDEDLDELKACIELGFGFDSPEVVDRRLSDTLPALELFYAVNKHYSDVVSKSASSLPTASDLETTPSPLGSPHNIFVPGENPQTVKTRLRHWAQVVACSVRQCSFR